MPPCSHCPAADASLKARRSASHLQEVAVQALLPQRLWGRLAHDGAQHSGVPSAGCGRAIRQRRQLPCLQKERCLAMPTCLDRFLAMPSCILGSTSLLRVWLSHAAQLQHGSCVWLRTFPVIITGCRQCPHRCG